MCRDPDSRVQPWVGSGLDFSEADPGIQLRGGYGECFRGSRGEAGAKPLTLKDIHFFRCHKERELWPIVLT